MDVIFAVTIRGRVQGVGYRAWAEVTALELGVEGWVRNRRDGSVEAVLAGSEEVVLTMIELCRDGPRGAQVTAIDQREAHSGRPASKRPSQTAPHRPRLGDAHERAETRGVAADEVRLESQPVARWDDRVLQLAHPGAHAVDGRAPRRQLLHEGARARDRGRGRVRDTDRPRPPRHPDHVRDGEGLPEEDGARSRGFREDPPRGSRPNRPGRHRRGDPTAGRRRRGAGAVRLERAGESVVT